MKTQLLLTLLLGFYSQFSSAQDCGCMNCQIPIIADHYREFKLDVSGAQFDNLAQNGQGVCSIEFDFAHDFLSDLDVYLTSPGGTLVKLVKDNVLYDSTYFSRWNIKFVRCQDGANPDPGFSAVFDDNTNWPDKTTFHGQYLPSSGDCLENFNSGPVNGTWNLSVYSHGLRGVGFIYGFKINFCRMDGIDNCHGLYLEQTGGEDCAHAEPFPTNYLDFVGNTAGYAASSPDGPCGTIENDQWFTFFNQCNDVVTFEITPGYCIAGNGLQLTLFDECSGNVVACNSGCTGCGWKPIDIVASVQPGKQYYLRIDGLSGDLCDFIFSEAPSCLSDLEPPPFTDTILHACPGTKLKLGLDHIPFGAAGYIWHAYNGALVNGKTIDTVPGPQNIYVDFTIGNANGQICVQAYNYTTVSPTVCLPFETDSLHFRVENATICYDEFPYISQYSDYGVPPINYAGTSHYTIDDFVDENGVKYACPLVLEVNVKKEGGISTLPPKVILGSSYTLPSGEVVTSSGWYFWMESLPSGCYNEYYQQIYLIDRQYESDGCLPDTVTYFMPGNVIMNCPGGSPPLVGALGPNKVIYNQAGDFDLIAHLGANQFVFADTVHITALPAVVAKFSTNTNNNILTFTNLSQNAISYLWDFGDGTTSTEPNPVHAYSAPGNYNVSLTAFGACPENQITKPIYISGTLPLAAFKANPQQGCAPLTIQYTNQSAGAPTPVYAWEFPGGIPSSSTEANPVVTYPEAGVYPATLTVSNVFGSDTYTESAAITVLPAPEAAFSTDVQAQNLTLSNLSQNADSYFWDFGDAATSSLPSPAHAYAMAGQYTITLLAIGICGFDTSQQVIEITGQTPLAAFAPGQIDGCVPLQVAFADQSQFDPVSWHWEFPGALPSSSTEQNPMVIYINPGVYEVSLTVENAFGSSSITQSAVVTAAPLPTASFNFTVAALQVNLIGQSQNANTCHWDFGDGQSDTSSLVSHLYNAPGTYLITFQCDNSCGSSIYQQWVTVQTSGIAEANPEHHLLLMPNPSDGRFYLDFQDKPAASWYWQLYNTLGQKVAYKACGAFDGRYKGEIDVRTLPAGAYWLEVGTEMRYQRLKVEIIR